MEHNVWKQLNEKYDNLGDEKYDKTYSFKWDEENSNYYKVVYMFRYEQWEDSFGVMVRVMDKHNNNNEILGYTWDFKQSLKAKKFYDIVKTFLKENYN